MLFRTLMFEPPAGIACTTFDGVIRTSREVSTQIPAPLPLPAEISETSLRSIVRLFEKARLFVALPPEVTQIPAACGSFVDDPVTPPFSVEGIPQSFSTSQIRLPT